MLSEYLSLSQLDIPVGEIYSAMGFQNSEPDEVSRSLTSALLAEAGEYVHPQFEYVILDGTLHNDSVVIGDTVLDTGRIIAGQMRGSSRFVLLVVTVGSGWTRWLDEVHKRDDVLQNYIADCIGSQIVESAADYMEAVLQLELDSVGLHRTNRFSPGYCGWNVSQQPALFGLFPDRNPCGVTLTDSCLMMPIKSVSGIIGIGADVRYLPYTCNICTMKMCLRRRK